MEGEVEASPAQPFELVAMLEEQGDNAGKPACCLVKQAACPGSPPPEQNTHGAAGVRETHVVQEDRLGEGDRPVR